MTSYTKPDVMTSHSTPDVKTTYSTPDVRHLTTDDYEHVYEPAEDTFLLLDSLEKDAKLIREKRPLICLEIGTGSGMCITFLAKIIGTDAAYFCTDINPRAAVVAMETGRRNDVTVEPVVCDLVAPLLEKMAGKCDVVLFNPPYVVTPSEEVGCSVLAASWAGGERGREVTDRLLPHVATLLSPGGLFYLLIIKENDEEEIKRVLGNQGLECRAVLRRRSGPELLAVLRFTKSPDDVKRKKKFDRPRFRIGQSQRLHFYLSSQNRKQTRNENLRKQERHRTLQLIHDIYPHLILPQTMPNYFIHDPPITKRLAFVFVHQPMGGDETMRNCLDLVSDKNKFVDSYEFTPEIRRKWDFMNGTRYKSKFDLHQGHFAFGVCNNFRDKHCAYMAMLREPFDRLRALLDSCRRRSPSNDPWCHNAGHVTTKQFLLNHGSTTFRQLVSGMEPCYVTSSEPGVTSSEPCWTRQKSHFDRNIPIQHKSALLNFVLENLDQWFSVIGLYENFESSLRLFAHAHRMPFDACMITNDVNDSDDLEEIQNGVHRQNSDSQTLTSEIDELKHDPEVLQALQPDIEIYKKATKIFRRQQQSFRNLL